MNDKTPASDEGNEDAPRREAMKGRVGATSPAETSPGDKAMVGEGTPARAGGPVRTLRETAGTSAHEDAPGRAAASGKGADPAAGEDIGAATREDFAARGRGSAGTASRETSGPSREFTGTDSRETGSPSRESVGTGLRTPGDGSRRAPAATAPREPSRTASPATAGGGRVPDSPLLPHDECDKFSLRLQQAVGGFIDEPRASVEEADQVLEELAARFTDAVTRRRRTLRTSWQPAEGGSPTGGDTEQLRLALRDYRAMAERLLRI